MDIKKNLFDFRYDLEPIKEVNKLVQHHPAANWSAERTHNFHKNSKGWNGIGYNYFVERNGTIKEGRGFNVAAHVRGYNSTTLGISYSGNLMEQEMTDEQLEAGIKLNAWLIKKFNLDIDDIIGHNDLSATSCPGVNFRMNELKEGVLKELNKNEDGVFDSFLKKGDEGFEVKKLQEVLIELGYKKEVGEVDGVFGKMTEKAVKEFQRKNGLAIDGLVGKNTRAKINENLEAKKEKEEQEEQEENVIYKVQVGAFSKRENADELAKKLKANGFNVYIEIRKQK